MVDKSSNNQKMTNNTFSALINLPIEDGLDYVWKKEQLMKSLEVILEELKKPNVDISLTDGEAEFQLYKGFDDKDISKTMTQRITAINLIVNHE